MSRMTKWVRRAFRGPSFKSSFSARVGRANTPLLAVEQLERREVLTSIITFPKATAAFSTVTGALTITGTYAADKIAVTELPTSFGGGLTQFLVTGVWSSTIDGVPSGDLFFAPAVRSIKIDLLEGNDTATVSRSATVFDTTLNRFIVNPWYTTCKSVVINGGAGDDTIDVSGMVTSAVLSGGAGNDTLTGSAGNDNIDGVDGNDLIHGGPGNDTLNGGVGNDTIYGDAGNDVLIGWEGDDYLDGGEGNDTLSGWTGNDTLNGGVGDDVLYGEAGNDVLIGWEGNDYLDGGAGNDTLSGWTGNDTLNGGTGDDVLYGEDGNDVLIGWDGNDLLDGGAGNDTLYGGAGNDTLNGGVGDDALYGEDGNDVLIGWEGNDLLDGGAGNDTLSGWTGNDTLNGGVGDDVLYGEQGNDVLIGWDGNDVLHGGDGNDTLYGGTGNDTLYGDNGDDALYGENGDDALYGGAGRDYLDGGAGNDGLFGGAFADVDTLVGGPGADRFLVVVSEDVVKDMANEDARLYFSTDGGRLWRNDEIEQLDKGFAWLQSLTGNTRLLRRVDGSEQVFQRVISLGAVNLADNDSKGQIRVGDRVFKDGATPDDIIVHEMGHNWDTESRYWGEWMKQSNWQELSWWEKLQARGSRPGLSNDLNWTYDVNAPFARDYGLTNPMEDWSTSWEVYYMFKQNPGSASAKATFDRMAPKMAVLDRFFASMR